MLPMTKHDGKVAGTNWIQTFLKKYKTIEANESGKAIKRNDIVLSNARNEVVDFCKHQLNGIKKSKSQIKTLFQSHYRIR